MNTVDSTFSRARVLLLVAAFLYSGVAELGSAQGGDYEIDWTSMGSGGEVVGNGDLDLLQVLGQPVAGSVAGGDFSLEAGFLNEDSASVPVELVSFTIE